MGSVMSENDGHHTVEVEFCGGKSKRGCLISVLEKTAKDVWGPTLNHVNIVRFIKHTT